jgi:mRNA-degrading endonuclease RelE of RelBE toxin-antitoxin system
MAKVLLTESARQELDELDRGIHHRILGILIRLEKWPQASGAKPLRHGLSGRYRIRTGDYRVQFRVDGQVIMVEKIGHRDGFYEE